MFQRLTSLFAPQPSPRFEPRRARGVADRSNPGVRAIVVRVDTPTFERINRAAAAAGVSMTEALRQLIQRGLEQESH